MHVQMIDCDGIRLSGIHEITLRRASRSIRSDVVRSFRHLLWTASVGHAGRARGDRRTEDRACTIDGCRERANEAHRHPHSFARCVHNRAGDRPTGQRGRAVTDGPSDIAMPPLLSAWMISRFATRPILTWPTKQRMMTPSSAFVRSCARVPAGSI